MPSGSFWIAISTIATGCLTASAIGMCRACFRFKCSSMEFCGMSFQRDIELENQAQVIEEQNPTDIIPRRTSSLPPSRRASIA